MSAEKTATWDGVTVRSSFQDEVIFQRGRLADAAVASDWPAVFRRLEVNPQWVNAVRIGSGSGYAVLHQAAWHGVDPDTVRRLVAIGAWRTLRTTAGDRAIDIARHHGHHHLAEVLRPVIRHPVPADLLARLRRWFHELIIEQQGGLVESNSLRLPELEPLTELADPEFWFPVPGMYGGFHCRLFGGELIVRSWSRVVQGSGRTHRITVNGVSLVDSGWC